MSTVSQNVLFIIVLIKLQIGKFSEII